MELSQDFDGLFDLLDLEKKGYLTVEQIQDFHESIHFKYISSKHVRGACKHVYHASNDDKVDKEHFLVILEELARRQMIEEQARWDFLALDTNGSSCIAVKDALLLFRATHGDQFSMQTWQRFLKSRENPGADVCFDEIKMWLCDPPSGDNVADQDYSNENSRLEELSQQEAENDFDVYQHKRFKGSENLKYQVYRDETKQLARRKQQRWDKEGIEALLYDDGTDHGEEGSPKVVRKKVRASDLIECLDVKYQTIRKKLFIGMLEGDMGEIMWSALTESEQQEALLQLQLQEEQLMKHDALNENTATNLPGSNVIFEFSLLGMMGAVSQDRMLEQLDKKRIEMQHEGKDTNTIEEELRIFFERSNTPAPSKTLVIELEERYKQEKERIMGSLSAGGGESGWSLDHLVEGYCRLVRQLAVAKLEDDLIIMATAVSLAERQHSNIHAQFSLDLGFQERLASLRMAHRKDRQHSLPLEVIDVANVKRSGKLSALVLLVEELTWKHAHEWQEFVNMLGDKQWRSVMVTAEQMSSEERQHWQSSLHQQRMAWRDSSANYRLTQKMHHYDLLTKATGVHLAEKRAELEELRGENGVDDDVLNTVVLRDLQILQDVEFDSLLQDIASKTEEELGKLAVAARSSRREELLDSIATLLLGSFDLSEEEKPFVDALEEKYRALQHSLISHALKAEHGLAWERLTEEQQQRKVVKKKNELDHLMQTDIHLRDVSSLIGAIPKTFPSLRTLIGEGKGEYKRRNENFYAQLEKNMESGVDPQLEEHENDEVLSESLKYINLVADLKNRFFNEQGDLLNSLRSLGRKSENSAFIIMQLAFIKFEQQRVEREEWFDLAAYSVGLLERNGAAREKRHPADRWRQRQLAELRVELYLMRVSGGQPFKKELDEYARPAAGDTVGWILSLLREMDKKHVEEREILLSVIQDPSLEELLEPAKAMSIQERAERLSKLRTKAFNLDMDDRGQREENFSILEEAAALKIVNIQLKLENENSEFGQRNVTVSLLADLQDEQDREMATIMKKLPKMDENEMKKARKFEIKQRRMEVAENVLKVFTQYDGVVNDDALIKALDDKYDALKDKLLMEALMKQIGEKEWQEMSEKERQRRLMKLKLEERKLSKEGKLDELAVLFGANQMSEELLRKVLGESRAEHERRLQERLARREKRIAQGLDPENEEDTDEETANETNNAMTSLMDRYQQDKDALLARLRGMNKEYLSEQERQAELLRLKRERLLAEKSDNFENAALLVGLAERQGLEAQERFEKDRLRQEQLAKERLEKLRQKRNQQISKYDNVVEEGSRETLMEAVIHRLEEKQSAERMFLVELLDGCHEDSQLIAMAMTQLECHERLHELSDNFERNNNKQLLEEAANIKAECRRKTLTPKQEDSQVNDEEMKVSILADLQEKQDQEVAEVIAEMQEKDTDELVTLQRNYIHLRDNNPDSNVAAVLFAPENTSTEEDQLLDALDTKYDALRDKLIAEALMNQLGESQWQNMSEQERQRRIAQLKLEERRLRQEGRYDEAAQLLGNAIRDQEAIGKLLEDTKADQERKLRERLARRQQAKERGLSDEEINQMEEEEMAKEEEQLRRGNILLALKNNYDKERDELMKNLEASKNAEDAEKKRQMMIARLKRDQRRMKQEERFDAAAVLMNMAKDQEKRLESDKEKQLQLARARLEARRARRAKGQTNLKNAETLISMTESEDVDILQDALLQEIEAKHQQEREFLLQMMELDETVHLLNDSTNIGDEEIGEQLIMMRNKRDSLLKEGELTDMNNIIQEGTGLKMVMVKHQMEIEGKSSAQDDIMVSLLAELQDKQDEEMEKMTLNIENMEVDDTKQLKNVQAKARQECWNDNIAKVVLGIWYEKSENAEIIQALDAKYDSLRDKLLMEALISQMGEAEWSALSEKERQQRLVKLKLEENRLRREGRYDEAAVLLGRLVDNQNAYNRKLGETKTAQKEKLEQRLKRRKELMMARGAKGLSTDETLLDALIDEEEEKEMLKRKNILEELQHHYEEEKAALLAAAAGQSDRLAAERSRQAQLVKLKRQQQLLDREDNFESAAFLLHALEEQQRNKEADFAMERERQRELAKERLNARRQRQQKIGGELSKEINEDEIKEILMHQVQQDETSDAVKKLAGVKTSEMVLHEMDTKHEDERKMMLHLIDLGKAESLSSFSNEELSEKLDLLQSDIQKWQEESNSEAEKSFEDLIGEERQQYLDVLATRRKELSSILSAALATTMRMDIESLINQSGLEGSAAEEETAIRLLTELQEKQMTELRAVENMVSEQDDDVLRKMHRGLRMSRQKGPADNIIKIIFDMRTQEVSDVSNEDREFELKKEELEEQLNEEFASEKEDLMNKAKTGQLAADVDLDAEMKKLQEQQDSRKKALDKALESQRQKVKARLDAKRTARDLEVYKTDIANEMIRKALQQNVTRKDAEKQERGRQNELMQQRLAARREARKQTLEEEMYSLSSSASSPLPPGSGLRREKTSVRDEMSEEKGQEIYTQLVREQTVLRKKITGDQQRQQEKVEKRLRERKNRMKSEINALFSVGELQKSILEKSRKEEKERQLTAMRERVARVRYERTITTKDNSAKNAQKFDELLSESEAAGLSENEKMELAARRMQDQLQNKTDNATDPDSSKNDGPSGNNVTSKKLDEEDKMKKLKERKEKKKMQKQQKKSDVSAGQQ